MSSTENNIDDAIRAHAEAEEWTGAIAGWVVLVAIVDHDGEDERSGVAFVYPGGSMPWPMSIGIVEAARTKLHHDFANGQP